VAEAGAHRLLGRLLAALRPLRRSEESNRPASKAYQMRQHTQHHRKDVRGSWVNYYNPTRSEGKVVARSTWLILVWRHAMNNHSGASAVRRRATGSQTRVTVSLYLLTLSLSTLNATEWMTGSMHAPSTSSWKALLQTWILFHHLIV
jgi:hypothetical protein